MVYVVGRLIVWIFKIKMDKLMFIILNIYCRSVVYLKLKIYIEWIVFMIKVGRFI